MSTPSKNYVASNVIDTTTGFTDRDEVLVSLHDIFKCPLVLESTDDMILFNDNCYDRKRFKDLQDFHLKKFNDAMTRGNYRFRKEIRDPRTNQDMEYDMAMTHHYYDSISISELQSVIHRRIPYLTIASMEEFIPPNHRRLVTVTAFVQHVMSLYERRKELIAIHFQQVQNRERRSGESVTIQASAPNPSPVACNQQSTVQPPIEPSPSDSSTDSEDSLDQVINRTPIRFGTQGTMNSSSSVSSTSESEDVNTGTNSVNQQSTTIDIAQNANTSSEAIDLVDDTEEVTADESTNAPVSTVNNQPSVSNEIQ